MVVSSKTKGVAILLIILIGLTVNYYYLNAFVPFEPLTLVTSGKDEGLKKIVPNDIFNSRIIKVLSYYKAEYYTAGGKVYIKRKVAKDKDLIWNYTNKAMDNNWLNSR